MTSRGIIPMVVLVLCVCPVLAQNSAATAAGAGAGAESETPEFPYIAEINAQDVYVRSGAGTAYYFTRKLDAPARVTVTGRKYGWAEILPPEGSFSWIYKNYVKLDPANPGIGLVTGDTVRVWAGSDRVAPANSSSMQAKLNTGDLVRLIDTQGTGDYYRIEPPAGARLYVSQKYLDYVGPVPVIKPILPPRPGTTPQTTVSESPQTQPGTTPTTQPKPTVDPGQGTPVTETTEAGPQTPSGTTEPGQPTGTETSTPSDATAVAPQIPVAANEKEFIRQCREIEKRIKAELAKPLAQQDYAALREQLDAIQGNPAAGNAKVYAAYYLSRIEAYELVREATEQVQRNEEQLAAIRKKVEADLEAKMKQIPNRGRFLLRGRIKPSNIYTAKTGQKRFIMLDETGRIVAYAIPANTIAGLKVKNVLDEVVGLVGKVVSDPKNPVTLIEFTEVEVIGEEKPAPSKPAEDATANAGD